MNLKRGYLLLESITAGGILAVAMSTSIAVLAHYRYETTMSARIQEASALAIATADTLATSGLDNATLPPNQPLTAVPNHPGFRVAYTLAPSGLHTQSTPPLQAADTLVLITVTVEYPTSKGPQTVVFQRLKRDRA